MKIVTNVDNGNVITARKNDNFLAHSNVESCRGTVYHTNSIVNNYHFYNNITENINNIVDNETLLRDHDAQSEASTEEAVCNRQYCLNYKNKQFVINTKKLTGANESNKSTNFVDGEGPFKTSKTENMSNDIINSVPRGIINPNYPGFQHLAHTLQEYSLNIDHFYPSDNEMSDDDNEMSGSDLTDGNHSYNARNNNELNNNISSKEIVKDDITSEKCQILCSKTKEDRNDIPDLLKTISSNNNNEDINDFDTDIENNFNTKDIIGDFNKEIEDEIKHLLNYNINIQDDLEELRKDIKDNFEKPIENTINNISEVVNDVIKKLVKTETCDEINNGLTKDASEINTKVISKECDIKSEINISRPTFLLLDNNTNQITDAVLSDGKEEINFQVEDYDTEKLSNNVENTIKQLSTELRKIIPKLNEMRERDKLWNDRPIFTDANANRISTSLYGNSKKDVGNKITSENNRLSNKNRIQLKKGNNAQSGTKDPSIDKSKCNAQINTSVRKDTVTADSDFDSFDVYNIETALPKLDIDAIENHIKAAKEAERRKRNDREEIRKRLAMGVDTDEYYSLGHTERPGKKPSLHSRLQNGKNLQICFMNETASDYESQSSDIEKSSHSDSKSISRSSIFSKNHYNHPYQTRPLSVNVVKSDKSNTIQSGFKFHPASFVSKPSRTRSSQSLNQIELKESDFYALQSTLQTEARIALAQAKEMARIQMEHERRSRPVSPVTEMLRRSMEKANVPLAPDRRRVSRQILTDMNIAQLQVIVNELHSQIESLNDSLVKLLMARDELHMGQDSMLVDIEDLTRYLGVKEQSKKSKGTTTKSGVKRLTSLVHK